MFLSLKPVESFEAKTVITRKEFEFFAWLFWLSDVREVLVRRRAASVPFCVQDLCHFQFVMEIIWVEVVQKPLADFGGFPAVIPCHVLLNPMDDLGR